MAATRRPRRETQAETRAQLLHAAEQLFTEHGFHRTSVAAIAQAAGLTTGAIYANFERKEDLAVAVLGRSIDQGEAGLVDALAVRGTLSDRLMAVIQWRTAEASQRDPLGSLRLELWLLAVRDERLRAALTVWQRRLQAHLARLLDEQAADLGVTYRVDTGLLAGALLTAEDGASLAHEVDPAGHHQQAYAWTLASLIVHAMDPCPIDPADWPAFVDALQRAAVSS